MEKRCAVCGTEFEAKRPSALYCSGRCRKRAQRQPDVVPVAVPEPVRRPVDVPDAALTAAARAELNAAGRLDCAAGAAVMMLARRIDCAGPAETGSAYAALVKEFRAALAEALANAEQAADPIDDLRSQADELRAHRERKQAR